MLELVRSAWTYEQTVLTVVIAGCCGILASVRPAGAGGGRRGASGPAAGGRADVGAAMTERWARVLVAVVVAAAGAFLVQRGGDPIGVRPDSWSDANVVVSGRNYAREGFWTHFLAAQHQVVTEHNPSDPFLLYTQYPVGSNVINGLWHRARVGSERVQRLVPAACSLTALAVWYGLLRRLCGPAVGAAAAAAMGASYGFLAYADSLIFHGYAMLTSAAALWCFVRAMEPTERRRGRWFAGTALFMFATAAFTWEYHFFMVLFIGGYSLLFPCPVRRVRLALLVLPLAAALGLQALQRQAALGGVEMGARQDAGQKISLLDDLRRRTIGFGEAVDTPEGIGLATYPLWLAARFYRFYGFPVPAAAAMVFLAGWWGRRAARAAGVWPAEVRLLAVLWVASAGWWLTMMQHTSVHPHVMRHGLAAVSLLLGLVWVRCAGVVRSGGGGWLARVSAGVLAAALLLVQAEGVRFDLRLHWSRWAVADERERGDAGRRESVQYSQFKAVVPAGGVILTNDNRFPPMRLWSERPVYNGMLLEYATGAKGGRGRLHLELSLNHLRALYGERLPRLYYVYRFWSDARRAVLTDPLLRDLLLGRVSTDEGSVREALGILFEADRQGSTDRSFCRILKVVDHSLVCFDMSRVVPHLRRSFDGLGYPNLRQYGPPR